MPSLFDYSLTKIQKIQRLSFLFFVAVLMVDPTNTILHIKEPILALFLLVSCFSGAISMPQIGSSYIFRLYVFAFISLISGLIFFGTDIICGIPYLKSLLILLAFFAMSRFTTRELLRYNFIIGSALSFLVCALFIATSMGYIDAQAFYEQSIDLNSPVIIAVRPFLGIEMPMFYYKTMPFCFIGLIYALRHGYYLPAITQLFVIIIAGSRTPILIGLTIVAFVLYKKINKKLKVAFFILLFGSIFYLFSQLVARENRSDGDLIKFLTSSELLGYSSILGHGVGAPYWSSSLHEMITSSEVTYFEMLYQYGWLLTPFVMYLLFAPFFRLYKSKDVDVKDFSFVYLLYLVNAGTNPLLFNSTGMFVYSCCLVVLSNKHKTINNNSAK